MILRSLQLIISCSLLLIACENNEFSSQSRREIEESTDLPEPEPEPTTGLDAIQFQIRLSPQRLEIQPGKHQYQFTVRVLPESLEDQVVFHLVGPDEKGDWGSISTDGLYVSPETIEGDKQALKLVASLADYPDTKDTADILVSNSLFLACKNSMLPIAVDLYELAPDTKRLPNFAELQKRASFCMRQYDVAPRNFDEGFPGVPDLFEWFGLQTRTLIEVPVSGDYTFYLNSDDGSILKINDELIIDNDGQHRPTERSATVSLTAGTHDLKIDYFQGPRFQIALELFWKIPGSNEKVLVPTSVFRQPPNVE